MAESERERREREERERAQREHQQRYGDYAWGLPDEPVDVEPDIDKPDMFARGEQTSAEVEQEQVSDGD